MMRAHPATLAGVTLAIAVFHSEPSHSETLRYPLVRAAPIVSLAGESRLLFDFGDLSGLDQSVISDAFLFASLPSPVRPSDVEIYVAPVTTNWLQGTATWVSPWRSQGGDYDGSLFTRVTLAKDQGGERLAVNVTEAVRGVVTGRLPAYGFIVSAPPGSRDGLPVSELNALGTLADIALVVNTAGAAAVVDGAD